MLGSLGTVLVLSSALAQQESAPFPLPTPTDKPATATFDELREGIKQYYQQLWAVEVEYRVIPKGVGAPRLTCHYAMKGEKRVRDQTGADGRPYAQAYDGELFQLHQADKKAALILKQKQSFVDRDAYLDALGIPLSDMDRANVSWLPKVFPYSLDVRGLEWAVEPTLQMVDGAECHVLVSADRQRLWIDPQIGFAMRFRERYQPVKGLPKAEWPLLARYFYREFEKTQAGIWLPKRNEIVSYASARSPRSKWNQTRWNEVHEVTRIAVGHQVKDSVFRFEFPPGTEVEDRVLGRFYRIGESGEELDMLVGRGRDELAKSGSRVPGWLLLLNIAMVAALALTLGYRLRRQPTSSKGT
jgi:hypothetical protein